MPISQFYPTVVRRNPSKTIAALSVLHRFLPFRLAERLGWLVVLLAPFATAAVFLFKAVPGLFQVRFKVRIRGLYRRLERVEKAWTQADTETLLDELDALDRESAELKVPRPLEASFFEFRQNLHDVRDRASPTSHGKPRSVKLFP